MDKMLKSMLALQFHRRLLHLPAILLVSQSLRLGVEFVRRCRARFVISPRLLQRCGALSSAHVEPYKAEKAKGSDHDANSDADFCACTEARCG
jgi:hypothetical protein